MFRLPTFPHRLTGGVLAAFFLAARAASGVILLATDDPTRNTSTPGDNSGWQYEGQWGPFLGTPIAPLYFLSAAHIGNAGGGTFVFHGETFTVVAGHKDPASDLMLWQVDHPFTDYAPMFTAAHGDETGQVLRVIGRGTQRGSEIDHDGTPRGWSWGAGDSVQRWGSNVVADVQPDPQTGAPYVHGTFDSPGVPDEAHLSVGDSGGAMFVQEDGLWKLAAINYAVDDLFTGADGSGGFDAAVFDARGFYTQTGAQTFSLLAGDTPVPTGFYGSRVAARLDWIAGFTGQDPATLPAESFADWQHLYFTPDQLLDDNVSGPNADPDSDGVPNLLEYAFNLDPTCAEPAPMSVDTGLRGLPLIQLEAVSPTENRLTVQFVRRTAASGSGLTYTAEFATNLATGDWQASGTESITAINARWERVKVTDSIPADGNSLQRFARVVVTKDGP